MKVKVGFSPHRISVHSYNDEIFLAVFENMALFRCQDPRRRAIPVDGIFPIMKDSKPLRFNARDLIEEGHYMLYLFGNASFVT